jgi:DNA-binding LacI/PurR family transcriptional regulator
VSRVTLQTIANRVGVSRMTVSNAFSKPDQLSAALRQRILAAADELGYVGPDPAGRALARGTSGAVGILLTDSVTYAFTDEVATSLLGAVADELAPTGLALTLLSTSSSEDVVPARDVPLDGAIVYSCDTGSPALAWLQRRGLPLVYVDLAPTAGVTSVNVDDRAGAAAAAAHLVALGHRRIDIVSKNMAGPFGVVVDADADLDVDHHVSRQRMLGWLDTLRAAGISARAVHQPHSTEDDACDAALLLLSQDDPPTAMLCFSDVMANGVVRAAEERGLRVPDELSVVGFDDSPLARRMRPALTTVRQPVEAKGRAAAGALTALITKAKSGTGKARTRHVVLPTELVVRDSTAPPLTRRNFFLATTADVPQGVPEVRIGLDPDTPGPLPFDAAHPG